MFDELNSIIKELIRLGIERRQFYEINIKELSDKHGNIIPMTKETLLGAMSVELSNKEKEIYNLMDQLTFEQIVSIQTIMYIGRDDDYKNEDSPDTRFLNKRKQLGFNSKEREIMAIVEKIPFDKYLVEGWNILNLEPK